MILNTKKRRTSTGKLSYWTYVSFILQHRLTAFRSQTCWLPAACFIRLRNTADVAAALKVIRHVGAKFAVRSGGHNPNTGFGSIDGSGVLLDLHALDSLSLSDDGLLHAGPGSTWGEVYDFLDPHGVSAIGGRHYTVGLPGFLLGGMRMQMPT